MSGVTSLHQRSMSDRAEALHLLQQHTNGEGTRRDVEAFWFENVFAPDTLNLFTKCVQVVFPRPVAKSKVHFSEGIVIDDDLSQMITPVAKKLLDSQSAS